ncbi:MAG: acyl-CoA thioesterase [Halioglobus sp.]
MNVQDDTSGGSYFHALLTPEPAGEMSFIGHSPPLNEPVVYGGQLMAQALGAAAATLDSKRPAHFLHCDFIAPGDPTKELEFGVTRIRDGKSTSHRAVEVSQDGRTIMLATLSFQDVAAGYEHQAAVPAVPTPPALLENPDTEFSFADAEEEPFPFRMLTCPAAEGAPKATSAIWAQAREKVPANVILQQQLLAFLSDATILQSAMLPHDLQWDEPGLVIATMNHAIWFHRPLDMNDWLLMYSESPSTSAGRALSTANLFSRTGKLIATVAQEGILRTRPA